MHPLEVQNSVYSLSSTHTFLKRQLDLSILFKINPSRNNNMARTPENLTGKDYFVSGASSLSRFLSQSRVKRKGKGF